MFLDPSSKFCLSKRLVIVSLLLLFFGLSVVLFSTLSSSVNKTTSSKAAELENVDLNDIRGENNSSTSYSSSGVKSAGDGINPCEKGIKQKILLHDPTNSSSPPYIITDTDMAGSNVDGLAIYSKYRRVTSIHSSNHLISNQGRWTGE